MKPLAIAFAGITGLVFVFVLEAYIPLVLVVLHCLTLCCILAGTLIPATTKRGKLMLYPKEGSVDEDESVWPCLESRKLDPGVQHVLEFHLVLVRTWFLAIVGTLSLSAIACVVLVNKDVLSPANINSSTYLFLFILTFSSFIPLVIAWSWLMERKLLASALIAIGRIISENGSYMFMNEQGEWHGGTERRGPGNLHDTLCVVFYLQTNAQTNSSSSSLLFHI